ncbi:DUF262 domain-containing protein [Tenacibaculum sp. Mcav3-52]|uniref:DUF262 domain-containing protein n=1 Tax=Tenacibaculum sp. Mcav3-52 TaxID=2917762 RepID=UPI001EF2D606|nr:DUF262 domain-containing protein [Tenacibaculum sp. Mcav3-52]MCG7502222.1 DUF262 domain-containing protein [Tenacibaculum sp. Mcav3-52]
MTKKLNTSIPANNWKIIELYNKIKKNELDPSPDFQRKLVWKKQHKYKFIETILMNFPFPEIYIAPGELDTETLKLKDLIVDGQQRTTTILSYIKDEDVFALNRLPIKKFSELTKEEKEDFLNYEVSVRYMKNANTEQIKEIFQRINSTEYSLNSTERLNAQWGDSEFVFFGKQIIEKKSNLNYDIISYQLSEENRKLLHNFFIEEFRIFTDNDIKRMLALQYILTIITTIVEEKYFRRNEKTQTYIEIYNEEFNGASSIEIGLTNTIKFIQGLGFDKKSYWFNKANIFTLIIELIQYDLTSIDKEGFARDLKNFELEYNEYTKLEAKENFKESLDGQIKYFEFAREAVNEIPAREHRGKIINSFITKNLIK